MAATTATITNKTFVYDLWLARDAAAWIERDSSERILIQRAGRTRCLTPVWGHPGRPIVSGNDAVWTEFREGEGRAVFADGESAHLIEPLAAANVGDLALSQSRLIAECSGSLRLLEHTSGGWLDRGPLWDHAPAYRRGLVGALAAWDAYLDARYRVVVMPLDGKPSLLPCPDDHWESLPALGIADNGSRFAARCRERLVDLPGGAVNHHSELVVAVQAGDTWRDVAGIDIDSSLNPWMAAYWGLRRFPRLVADADGAWLLWEEKLDSESMDPAPGRLCGVRVTPQGLAGEPVILINERCMIVTEAEAHAPSVRAATKTQWRGFAWYLEYEHTTIDLRVEHAPQPSVGPTHANLPTSHVTFTRPQPRPIWLGTGLQLYFGDPQNHSRLSYDLDGEPDELYHVARDIGGLDFIAFTENDGTRFTEPLTPADWERSRRLANLFDDPGRFTAFVAWEYTLHTSPHHPRSVDSHRSVIFPGRDARICSWVDDTAPTPAELVDCFRGERVLLHYHHPGEIDIGCDALERNVELCSGWWNCMRLPSYVERLHARLNSGLRLGFIGASDNHERGPGLGGALTGIWATENTREAIFTAFEARRVFATTGLRPELRFSIGDLLMGSEGDVDGPPELAIYLRSDVSAEAVEIIRDGTIVHVWEGRESELAYAWSDPDCPAGQHWYYVHIRFEAPDGVDWSQPMPLPWNVKPARGIDAWTSPIYVNRQPDHAGDAAGAGAAVSGVGPATGLPVETPMITERENTLRAIEHRYPEWIPIHFDLMPSVAFRHGMKLADMMSRHPQLFSAARIEAVAATTPPSETSHERRFIDDWGCEWLEVQAGILGQVVGHPLADWDKLAQLTAPDPARQWNWEAIRPQCRQQRERGELVNGYMGVVQGGFFDRLQFLRGLGNLLVDLLERPQELDRLIALVLDYNMRLIHLWLDAGAELIHFHGDIGMQHSLMMSPTTFREVLEPAYREMFQTCRRAGAHVKYSSDGCLLEIVDDLVECGVSFHDPQVRACGIDAIARAYGGKLCAMVDIGEQMLRFASPDEIDAQIREIVEKVGRAEGGLMLYACPSADVPVENIEAICTAWERYCAPGNRRPATTGQSGSPMIHRNGTRSP